MADPYFSPDCMRFLRNIAKNNNRDWFTENKMVYEEVVRTPALRFIADMADDLAILSPHFLAQPKKVGGSLMRIYRDVRFGRDKRPYKTNIGIQFRHEQGKDVHAPGFYVHIEPGECFVGVGIWRPDSPALGKIRDRICEHGDKWQSAINQKTFKKHYELSGDSLINAPRGYAKDHPLVHDLKRKDFIGISRIDDDSVLSARFRNKVFDRFKVADSYMQFLCQALELRY
ncbi:DUF2461 domain-containing protein [Sulfuriflexus mobilis]|uniref:DUF2461 domain-containing protein n=1 Tax=Sulfuriflexus mobilis TaxID=1811807 RepID=UPI000F824A1E|nr:DUF2461 domain-containing protein [Sulfuriflexus mobilis]